MPLRRSFLAITLATLFTACTAPPAAAVGGLVDLQIVDRQDGGELPLYRHASASYVAGRPGARYALRLTNRSPGRLLVVVSVDGVNAISGETANVNQTGYVLQPYGSTEITGWRKNLSEAGAFYFTALPDSYAARTDRPANVGVIGAAVFRERVPTPVAVPPVSDRPFSQISPAAPAREEAELSNGKRQRYEDSSANSAAPNGAQPPGRDFNANARAYKLGTGHGEREYSPLSQTTFERATQNPFEMVQVRYDSYANLLAMGVIEPPRPRWQPEAFPRFVPNPR